jgi:hypothetical protein
MNRCQPDSLLVLTTRVVTPWRVLFRGCERVHCTMVLGKPVRLLILIGIALWVHMRTRASRSSAASIMKCAVHLDADPSTRVVIAVCSCHERVHDRTLQPSLIGPPRPGRRCGSAILSGPHSCIHSSCSSSATVCGRPIHAHLA